ncbi:MAG: GNAT family N-acetyltransferase [Eubacteriaceae bacterium]
MKTYNIREMTIEDFNNVIKLWKDTPGIGLSNADSNENIAKFLNKNKGLSFVCLSDNKIIGTILCSHDGRRGYIYHLTVHNNYRNTGIAKRLIMQSINMLKKSGIDKCHLFTFNDNVLGKNFWSKMDWTKREDIIIFSKNISK